MPIPLVPSPTLTPSSAVTRVGLTSTSLAAARVSSTKAVPTYLSSPRRERSQHAVRRVRAPTVILAAALTTWYPSLHSPLSTSPMRNPTPPTPPRREVPLAQLMDGRGRAPRTGAAAALGFDYVPRPTVVPIEDEKITEPQPTEPRSSFWAWRERYLSATPPLVEAAPVSSEPANGSALGPAPQTPALEPHITDDDDDDWEHVHAYEDHVFGDLELDTDMDASDVLPAAPKGGKAVADASELPASAPQT